MTDVLPNLSSFNGENSFTFLNVRHDFVNQIDWDYSNYGKLWTYNLNYFDFLLDKKVDRETGLTLIKKYISQIDSLKIANDPYPTSIRIINWCKFVHRHAIDDKELLQFIASDLDLLSRKLEYHLKGNHLLENAFALYFGGSFLGLDKYTNIGKKLMVQELNEQILNDGGHFERSPMYQLILLERLLDCINIAKKTEFDLLFLELMTSKAQQMINWINTFSFRDNSYAMMNDATNGIAKDLTSILDYAKRVDLNINNLSHLDESGYRKINQPNFEMVIDAGDIGPNYLPAHAHCDTLSFELYVNGFPFIVDTGTSSYEAVKRRQLERSTSSHNTVMVNNTEQSEIWGAFRVARRAYGKILEESEDKLIATHDGFKRIGANHIRTFEWSDDTITINDKTTPRIKSEGFLHFHDNVFIELTGNCLKTELATIQFDGAQSLELEQYELCKGFNRRVPAQKLRVTFNNLLKTTIHIN